MRIAVSSSPFRQSFAAGELTQLEWLERCASALAVDGVLADVDDFPRTDAEYVAQLRKVAIDLGLVPLGIDAPALLKSREDLATALGIATGFGAALLRTRLPEPGDVPPAAFVEAVGRAKTASRAAKAANVTLVVAAAAGTLGADLPAVKHLLKDVDSAWLRAAPRALDVAGGIGPKDRYPALIATPSDAPEAVVPIARAAWLVLDVDPVSAQHAWERLAATVDAFRRAEAEYRLVAVGGK